MDFLLTHTMLERAIRRETYANGTPKDPWEEYKKDWNGMAMSQKIGTIVREIFAILLRVVALRMSWACSGKGFAGVVMAFLSFVAPHIAIPYYVMFARSTCSAYWA